MQQKKFFIIAILAIVVIAFQFCSKSESAGTAVTPTDPYVAIKATFGTKIDPNNLANYAAQGKPAYILKDNTGGNNITNTKASPFIPKEFIFYSKPGIG